MQQKIITIVLLIGLFFGLITLVSGMSSWRLPDHETGYSPKQPIDYSHRLHAGELGINCRFCHTAAETSRHAGIPSSDVCMKCHKHVTTSFSVLQDEIKKLEDKKAEDEKKGVKSDSEAKLPLLVSDKLKPLYHSFGLDETLKPREGAKPQSIPWVRVHNLPDYVYFDHRPHVGRMECQACHGPVETMERVRQETSLSMGWCVECHRINVPGTGGVLLPGQEHPRADHHVSTDCSVCHY